MANGHNRVAITGSSGLVGTALRNALETRGIEVLRLVRRMPTADDEVTWNPQEAIDLDSRLDDLDAVVHLAGANIASGRWTNLRRGVLRDSRIAATHALVESLGRLDTPPRAFVQASAVGWYGSRGDEALDERSSPGTGFLAELARDWEQAGAAITQVHTRWVALRIGMVLDPVGGALARMLPIFRLGLGGRLGAGRQWVSWIGIDDLVEITLLACLDDSINGAVNAVSPEPVTNREFTRALAHAVHRRAILPAPAMALGIMLGGIAPEVLLASQRCLPGVLADRGHAWAHPGLGGCLEHLLEGRENLARDR